MIDKLRFNKFDSPYLPALIVFCGIIPLLYVAIHENTVNQHQLEDVMIDLASDDDCKQLQKQLDDWNERILKPKRVVDFLKERMVEIGCSN